MNLVLRPRRLSRLLFAGALSFFLFLPAGIQGQTASCFRLEAPMIAANVGDTVDLPIRVYAFDSIASMQFTIGWLPGIFDTAGIVIPGNLTDLSPSNFNLTKDRIRLAWYSSSLPESGISLPDSTVIFTIRLRVNDAGTPQHLVLLDDSPQYTPAEIVRAGTPVRPIPVTFEIGNIWAGPIPYDMHLQNTCISGASACNTADAAINVEVGGGIPPYAFQWTGPNGVISSEQNLTNIPAGIYYLTVTDQIASTTSGIFKVPQHGQTVTFSTQVTPASCTQNDGCIDVVATSGLAPLSYNWSPPLANTSQVCGLTSGVYSVTVTGADGCFATAAITVDAGNNLQAHILASYPLCSTGQKGTAAAFAENGLPPYTYLWSTGSSDAVIGDLYAGPYSLTVTDMAGCTGTDNIFLEDLGVQAWGLELIPNCPSAGNPAGNVLLRAGDPSTIAFPINLFWSNGTWTTVAAASGDTLDLLQAAPSGLYQVTAVDSLGCSQFLETTLACFSPAPPDSAALVWPGDADNNNAVNHHDLLYLGLAYGTSGPTRVNASSSWSGQPAPDWPQSTTQRAVNFKNMDTDGDGLINSADTAAIMSNWGQVIDPANDNPFAAPAGVPGMAPPPGPQLSFVADTLTPGQTVAIPIVLGTPALPADSLHGLSFSISYDPKIMTPLYFEPLASWFGDPAAGLLCVQRHFPGQHRLDIALTRTDGLPANGVGIIGRTFIVIEDDIFFRKDIDHAEGGLGGEDRIISRLNLTNVQALSPANTEPDIVPQATPLLILNTVATSLPERPSDRLECRPNPVSDALSLHLPSEHILAVSIFDIFGRVRADLQGLDTPVVQIPVHDWSAGTYLAQVHTRSGVYVKTFVCQ